MRILARAIELVAFLAVVWALTTQGLLAGFMAILFFLFIAHELKHV